MNSNDISNNPNNNFRVIQTLSSIAVPIIIVVFGFIINSSLQDREVKVRYVELAINILQSDPTPDNKEVRKYAIDILSKYSEIPITDELRKSLETKPLVKGSFIMDDHGVIPTDDSGGTITDSN